jgi:uncharacterized membrane protein
MVDVKTEIVIRRPRQLVASYASNPDNVPGWYENIKSVEWKTPKPVTLGSKISFVAYFLGRKLSYTYEVVQVSENRFVMRTAEGPFPMETTYEWQSVDADATRMTLRNRGNPLGFSKIVAPFMSFMMRKANQKDLARLKEVLEIS